MKTTVKALLVLSTILAGVANAPALNYIDASARPDKVLIPGVIDRSEHSLEQIEAHFVRSNRWRYWLEWSLGYDVNEKFYSLDLNDPVILRNVINGVIFALDLLAAEYEAPSIEEGNRRNREIARLWYEINLLSLPKPYQGSVFNHLSHWSSEIATIPRSGSFYLSDEAEPVTNPIISGIIALLHKRYSNMSRFRPNILQVRVTTRGQEEILYTLKTELGSHVLSVKDLRREIVINSDAPINNAAPARDEL